MSADPQTALTFWLGRSILQAQDAPAQELLLDEIEDRVTAGASLETATDAVIQTAPRAGDFGVEIAGSILAVVVTEGLKLFWEAYLDELRKKLAGKLADLTFDGVKKIFKTELTGPRGADILNKLKSFLQASAARRGVAADELQPLMGTLANPAYLGSNEPPAHADHSPANKI